MKITPIELAKALYKTRHKFQPNKKTWEKLEHHEKIHWKCEADHVIRALRMIKEAK